VKLSEYRTIAPAINKELEELFKRHGLKMGKLGASIEEHTGTVRYSITCGDMNLKDASGNATSPEAERFKLHAHLFGMKPEWLGNSFTMRGAKYTIAGLKSGRSSKCVILEKDDKRYVMTPEDVVLRMTAAMQR
jgi:hypothetical protein